jgi:hypothetical protein
MQFSKKALVLPASLAIFASSTLVHGAVIYTAQGFEPAGGFSVTGGPALSTDPADLYGQGSPYWAPDILPPSDSAYGSPSNGVAADVETSVTHGGTQAVSLTRLTSSQDTRWAPSAFTSSPYQAVADNTPVVDINWDMQVAPGGSNDLFGIELNNGVSRIAYTAVDASGNVADDRGGVVTDTGTSVSTGEWASYDLRVNFSTQTYQVFVNGSPVDPSIAFEDPATEFTDASLVSYTADGGPGSGVAYYDNYSISVPEPKAVGSVCAGMGLLLLRRRRDGSAV